jgi:hypothetical protein
MTENENPTTTDNIRIAVYDKDDAPDAESAREAEPEQVYETHNTTREEFHSEIVEALNGNSPDLTVDSLALGDSTLATADVADDSPLGNELFRKGVTDSFVSGTTFTASTFIDSTQANGLVLEEASLVSEQSNNDLPVNRFLVNDPSGLLDPKENDSTVTIDVELTVSDA